MPDLSGAFAGRTILVTGGAGAIGANLVKGLDELGPRKILILDNFSSAVDWTVPRGERIHLLRGDILDDVILKKAFEIPPDVVYHLAAHFANQNSVDHPEMDLMVNGMGMLRVLMHSRRARVDRFIYASSGCGIYGNEVPIPFTEESVSTQLYTPYQVTKMLGELYTNMYHNLYGLPIVNARFFNSYGPGEVPGKYRNVIPNFFYWAIGHQPLPITGSGDETRDFTYVGDIVSGLLACAAYPEAVGEAFNLAAGREIRVIDLAKRVNELTKNDAGIVFRERRNWDKKTRLVASIEKARRILHYEPRTTFDGGLDQVHVWFKKNWKRILKSAEF